MTGPAAEDVAARLQQLALRAPATDDGGTADRALAVNRHRRHRAVRWVAGAVAVVVLGTAAVLARPAEVTTAAQTAPATTGPAAPTTTRPPAPPPPPPEVYEQPPRGSLAGDADFLAGVAALPWSEAMNTANGTMSAIEPETRRVVYAADVPGGHRWALVMARAGRWWAVDWFAGPSGADPAGLTEVQTPSSWSQTQPLALMDVSAASAPIVVFGDPDAAYEYSPSLDRAPDGSLVREYAPLPVVDGVPLGEVPAPVHYSAGEVRAVGQPHLGPIWDIRFAGPPPWESWWAAAGPPDLALLTPCMAALGYRVEAEDDAGGYSITDTVTAPMSSDEQAAREKATAECQTAASSD